MSTRGVDYVDESVPLLGILVYKIFPLTEKLWFFFPIICYILAGNPNKTCPEDSVISLQLPEKQKEYIENALIGWG